MKTTRFLNTVAIVAALAVPTFALAADQTAKPGDAVESQAVENPTGTALESKPADAMTGEATETEPAGAMTGEATDAQPGDAMTGEATDAQPGDAMTGEATDAQPDGEVADASSTTDLRTVDPGDIKASEFLGQRVYTPKNEWIGEVGDVILTADGDLEQIVVDYGGWLGIGEKQVAVPMDSIQFKTDGDASGDYFVYVDMSKADFEAAEAFEAKGSREAQQRETAQ